MIWGYIDRGDTFRAMGSYSAVGQYGTAVDLFPTESVGYTKRGDTYREMGKYDLALAEYDKIVKLIAKQKRKAIQIEATTYQRDGQV